MEYPSLDKPKAGAFRFNTDSSQLEIYDGNQWTGVLSSSPELRTGGGRGLSAGGNTPGQTDVKLLVILEFEFSRPFCRFPMAQPNRQNCIHLF